MSPLRFTCLAMLTMLLGACSSTPAVDCRNNEKKGIQDFLYFGTAQPDGVLSAAEWATFLNNTISPLFPNGLSYTNCSGQWRDAEEQLIREACYVLQLVHEDDAASEQGIQTIIASYKARFQQQAVLRVKTPACFSF
jgi:hypothetical protein